MPSKLQKNRRKYTAMMIYEIEWLLLSSKVVGDDCTFISDFLVYLELLNGDKSDSSIFRILISDLLFLLLFSS
jgi:hypothetical protein